MDLEVYIGATRQYDKHKIGNFGPEPSLVQVGSTGSSLFKMDLADHQMYYLTTLAEKALAQLAFCHLFEHPS